MMIAQYYILLKNEKSVLELGKAEAWARSQDEVLNKE